MIFDQTFNPGQEGGKDKSNCPKHRHPCLSFRKVEQLETSSENVYVLLSAEVNCLGYHPYRLIQWSTHIYCAKRVFKSAQTNNNIQTSKKTKPKRAKQNTTNKTKPKKQKQKQTNQQRTTTTTTTLDLWWICSI